MQKWRNPLRIGDLSAEKWRAEWKRAGWGMAWQEPQWACPCQEQHCYAHLYAMSCVLTKTLRTVRLLCSSHSVRRGQPFSWCHTSSYSISGPSAGLHCYSQNNSVFDYWRVLVFTSKWNCYPNSVECIKENVCCLLSNILGDISCFICFLMILQDLTSIKFQPEVNVSSSQIW